MELDEMFGLAGEKAIQEAGITNATFLDALPHIDSDRWSVRYRESPGKYFRVVVDPTELVARFDAITVENLSELIVRELQARNLNEYLPGAAGS